MNEVSIAPFEFKIPALPARTNGNVIPTGKQIPRTPIKIEKKNIQGEEHQNSATVVVPTECHNNITRNKKNWIPKGKEIPRTPIGKISPVLSSSSDSHALSLPDADLGVNHLCEPDENDSIDYNIEISILTGKINLRKHRPLKKDVDDETQKCIKDESASKDKRASKENEDCINSTTNRRARCKGKSVKDTSEQLCKDMETKCAIVKRPQLQNISNEVTSVRRNPSRRAKANVIYKL